MSDIAFVFVDIETTGLEPNGGDKILEVGVALTDKELNIINGASWIVAEMGWLHTLESNDFVNEMHENSGLKSDILLAYPMAPDKFDGIKRHTVVVESDIEAWLSDNGVEPKKFPMAGSSVHFDHEFIREQMPRLNDWFTHRNADVSSLKEFCRVWYPDLYDMWAAERPKDQSSHRALPDIHDTIDELRFYKQSLLIA